MVGDLKRDAIKYIRDKAKSAYEKQDLCYICGTEDNLDFHHFYSLTELFNRWLDENGIEVTCVKDIVRVREEFIETHKKELYIDAVTICHAHHQYLHKLYGIKPALTTAEKQRKWVEKQREKAQLKNGKT